MLVLTSFGENAGFLGGFLETTQRTFDRFSRCNANFHRQPSLRIRRPLTARAVNLVALDSRTTVRSYHTGSKASIFSPLAGRPLQGPAGQDVQVQVIDGLAGVGALVDDDAIASA